MDFCEIFINSKEYKETLFLRDEILRIPIGLSIAKEDLSQEGNFFHFIAKIHSQVIACLITTPTTESRVRLRQMCVLPEFQGKNIGLGLVEFTEKILRERGIHEVTLAARKTAVGFYRKLGYTTYGEEFIEVTLPHIMMRKKLLD